MVTDTDLTDDNSGRLEGAYADLHGRLCTYYEDIIGCPTDIANTHAQNLIGEYAEALTDHLNEARR